MGSWWTLLLTLIFLLILVARILNEEKYLHGICLDIRSIKKSHDSTYTVHLVTMMTINQ
nr:hypothetical protein [Legionella sp. PC1000]